MRRFEDFLFTNRELVIAGFAVPASFAYRMAEGFGNWLHRTFRNTSARHDESVRAIQARVRAGHASGKRMCTARKPWKTMAIRTADFKQGLHQIPIDLRNVLEVDEERRIARVEPMVTMGQITHFLAPRGFALAVQVEMEDLTVGGLCMGVGIESSSHREGFLFETVEAFELVTAEGERVRATRDLNADLFHALPWSHGTLGFLVSVELRMVPIESHVRLEHEPFHSMDAFCARLEALVFFQLKDIITFANKPWYRYLWAWMGAPKVSLMKLTMTRELRFQAFVHRVAQDILLPIEDLADSVRLSDQLFDIYPLWICPVRLFDHGAHEGFLRNPASGAASQIFVDVGIYGIPPSVREGRYDQVRTSRRLEKFVRERGGYQMLYADICMTREEFEQMFEHRLYREMRRKHAAESALPEVYEKVLLESWLTERMRSDSQDDPGNPR